MGQTIGGIEWEPRSRTEEGLVLPQGHAAEEPQDQVVVGVVPGVLDGHILEQTTVHPKDVVHPGPHLLDTTRHAPHLALPCPQELVR